MTLWKRNLQTMENKLINILTICRKAGGITTGFDPVKEGSLEGKIFVVLLASDISEKSEKEIRFSVKEKAEIIKTEITKKEFEFYLGKFCAIIGITNKGFADKIREILA